MRHPLWWLTTLFVAAGVSGCGGIETTDTGDESNPRPTGQRPPIAEKFVHEPYGIGAFWYDYDSETHAVTPRDEVYRIRRDGLDALVEVTSYYDDRGKSGYFTLKSRPRRDGGWGETRSLNLSQNVKEEPVCVALDPLERRDCEAGGDLVLRTDLRTVPAAGFAVSNPAIYARGHHAKAYTTARVAVISTEKIDSLPDSLDAEPLADARHAPSTRAIRARGHVHFQATGDMMLAQWRISRVKELGDRLEVKFRSRCVDLAASPEKQTDLSTREPEEKKLSVPTSSSYAVSLVDVCDASVVDRNNRPYDALWPQTDSFDLFLEQIDGSLSVRVAPGHLVWDWTAGAGEGSTSFESVDLPDGLWTR